MSRQPRIALVALALFAAACGTPTPSVDPSSSPAASSARPVSAATIENAGLALVAPPAGLLERAGISGRGPVAELVLTGPFYGERVLVAVCDGGGGEIAYAVEGAAEFTPLLACRGVYGGASRTMTLAAGYLVFDVRGEASMRWHVAVGEIDAPPASSRP